jgi:hypothetical protein
MDWPPGTTFVYSDKTYMQTSPMTVSRIVRPGETYEWTVVMMVPNEFRIHSTVFRMKTPEGEEFGDKCLCEV